MIKQGRHCVAVFGGAVSGAEAAMQLANQGIHVVLFEQNALPYGKIEDGLPKWHSKLRDKEESKIDEKLDNEYVHFVPLTKLGREVSFQDIVEDWGFSAVLLATGAWRDRSLGIANIDDYIGKGLYYQNGFFQWYNHFHEAEYSGPQLHIPDETIIVGGGLASIDVAKAVMILMVEKALKDRGIEVNGIELERGVEGVLEKNNLTLNELGLKGCTLYYRRRAEDMPLVAIPEGPPELIEKGQQTRLKIMAKAQRNFLFHFKELHTPVDIIANDGTLEGLVFANTTVENGKATVLDGSEYEVKAPLVISSVGSLPEMIEGIPSVDQVFKIKNNDTCQLAGFDNVFIIGNAVAGKGNIRESFLHSQEMSKNIIDNYLEMQEQHFRNILREKESGVQENIETITSLIESKQILSDVKVKEIEDRITALWAKVNYDGNYRKWIQKHIPKRLEEQVSGKERKV